MGLIGREPAAVVAAVLATFETGLGVLVVFGIVDWTPEQTAALMGFVGSALALAGGLFVRSKVQPL